GLDGDDALAAAALGGEVGHRCALAVAVLADDEDGVGAVARARAHPDQGVPGRQRDATDAARLPAHGPHLVLLEANRLALLGHQDDVGVLPGQLDLDQLVALVDANRLDAGAADLGEGAGHGLLDRAQA